MNSLQTLTVNRIETLLSEAGLHEHVTVDIEFRLNEREKKTPHVVATYTETVQDVNDTKDGWIYIERVTRNIEELNKYFGAEIFAMGITQRAEWLKATHADRTSYLQQPGFNHPAQYKK